MAAVRLIALHANKGKSVAQCLGDRTDYAKNPEKTEKGNLVTAYECDPMTVDEEFMLSKRKYQQITGREQQSDVIAYQIRQSFKPGEITTEEANRLGYELAMRFTKGKYAFIVATHTDRAHIHNHVIFNSTALDGTRKFQDFHLSGLALQRLSDVLCLENGLSIIAPKPYSERQKRTVFPRRPKLRDQLCEDIDRILNTEKKPKDFNEFLQMLEAAEYEIKKGKNISVRGNGQKRFIRLSSLPEEYREARLQEVLEGTVEHTPNVIPKATKRFSLVVDIQAKLQERGAGYERWAKKFNLKQMSQTLLFLRDKGLDSIEDLDAAAAASVAKRDALLADIKKAETRLVEIGVLKKHIVNYSETRSVYEEYRRSGYSKKFLEEHREAITLHKAAKKAFDELGVKKIPKVKDLSAEYAQILADKKRMYAEYRHVRDEVRELLIAKRNIATLYAEDHADEENQKKKTTKDR